MKYLETHLLDWNIFEKKLSSSVRMLKILFATIAVSEFITIESGAPR